MTTPAEDEVIAKAKIGERAILTPEIGQQIPASLIRALLLGTPPPGHTDAIPLPGQVLRISGAHIIEGPLDLADCTGPGGAPLPGLALENCVFYEDMDLSHAHLAKLSLQGSAIHGVTMHGIQLQAGLDCSNTQAQTENGPAWIDAHAAKIQGGVNANGAKLRANIRPEGETLEPWKLAYYALRLSDAVIEGRLTFENNFVAIGGIHLGGARVTGDMWGRNAMISAADGYALIAQNAYIGGLVSLDDLRATGSISMLGIQIVGILSMSGAKLKKYSSESGSFALIASHATIGGDLLLSKAFTAEGGVSFFNAKINGNFDCHNGHFANHKPDGEGFALVGQGIIIGGAVFLSRGFTAEGQVSFLDAKISGSLDCSDAIICNFGHNQGGSGLDLTSAEIKKNVSLERFTSIGRTSFWGCRIDGRLECVSAQLIAWGPNNWSYAFDGRNLILASDITFSGTNIVGSLVLEHAQIGGTITWGKTEANWLGEYFPRPLHFKKRVNIKIPRTDNGRTEMYPSIWGYAGQIIDDQDAETSIGVEISVPSRFDLAHAKIGASLQAYDLIAEVPLLIDLSAAHAYTLDDDASKDEPRSGKVAFPSGWGKAGDSYHKPDLDLDGFTYQRIEHFCAEIENPKDIHTPRLKWLERQYKKPGQEDAFYPQPYRHLATVLRALGHREAARKIAIAEGHASASGLLAPLYKFFWGELFGFGLSPRRALIVMLATILIGWGMVKWADHNQVLTLTPDRVEAYAIEHPLPPNQTNILKCGPSEIWPSFYALDMAIPLIPLHQEDRCEVNPKPGTWAWQLLWAFYSIIAKIITSLALITISGVMKPKDE